MPILSSTKNHYEGTFIQHLSDDIYLIKIAVILLCFMAFTHASAQDAQSYYNQALEKAQSGKLEEAIKLFDKSVEMKPDEFSTWYNRGIAKNMLKLYELALPDFEQTIKLNPNYKNGYLNRGTTKKRLTDYEGAMADYNYAITLDAKYAEAYYNRGLVYEMLGNYNSACADFNKSHQLGLAYADRKVGRCKERNFFKGLNPILRLTETADNEDYGFTEKNPVKVGCGPDGGPANQIAYLELLRDQQGKPIKYERLGPCCAYKSRNGLLGMAMLDKYQITFLDKSGKETNANVYLNFYDYEEPKILQGLKTIGQK